MSLTTPKLERGLSLRHAIALNMTDMVGIGPFIAIPFVVDAMNGPICLIAWVLGAILAFADGLVWSELGAAMPAAGGSFVFLRETYGKEKWGSLMSFLYIWQTVIQAPLVIASGAIGFSQYFGYLVHLETWQQKAVAGALVILLIIILYRKITTVGKISVVLWTCVIATLVWVIFGGLTHFHSELIIPDLTKDFTLSAVFFAGLGQASVKTIYCYLGYYNICHLGEEIKDPQRNIPRSILFSIFGIAIIYLLMQVAVMGAIPWQEIRKSEFIVSTFFERIYGSNAAIFATALILVIAASSLFSAILGYSRIPYAAAKDGKFFSIFARLHPRLNFPHTSLLILGGIAFIFSLLFKLKEVITAIIVMRILIQFVGQSVGLILWRRKVGKSKLPFKMWLYPIPVIIAISVWIYIFFSVDVIYMLYAGIVILVGILLFLAWANVNRKWPYQEVAPPELLDSETRM